MNMVDAKMIRHFEVDIKIQYSSIIEFLTNFPSLDNLPIKPINGYVDTKKQICVFYYFIAFGRFGLDSVYFLLLLAH